MATFPKKVRSAKYTRQYPPPNEEAARERIDQITKIIERINTELEHTGVDDFETEDDYFGWKGSASGAIGHYKHELRFLEEWLKPPALVNICPADVEMLQRLRDKVAELVESLEADYAPVYSDSYQPPNLVEARARLQVLGTIYRRLMEAFAEAGNLWTSRTLTKKWLSGVRAPLQSIATEVSDERAVIKAYIRVRSTESNSKPGVGSWHATCLEALRRAVAGGFQLTEVEQEVLRRMEEHQKIQLEEAGAKNQ